MKADHSSSAGPCSGQTIINDGNRAIATLPCSGQILFTTDSPKIISLFRVCTEANNHTLFFGMSSYWPPRGHLIMDSPPPTPPPTFPCRALPWKGHIVKHWVDWIGLDWICKTWTGFVKGGFVKHGFVKHGFVKGGFVKSGFVKGGFVKHGFVKHGFVPPAPLP